MSAPAISRVRRGNHQARWRSLQPPGPAAYGSETVPPGSHEAGNGYHGAMGSTPVRSRQAILRTPARRPVRETATSGRDIRCDGRRDVPTACGRRPPVPDVDQLVGSQGEGMGYAHAAAAARRGSDPGRIGLPHAVARRLTGNPVDVDGGRIRFRPAHPTSPWGRTPTRERSQHALRRSMPGGGAQTRCARRPQRQPQYGDVHRRVGSVPDRDPGW